MWYYGWYMSSKRIILAHGLNGELGVPVGVNQTGLPWPRLSGDMEHLKEVTNGGVVILGRKSYALAARYLASRNRMVIGVGSEYQYPATFPSIESALAHAHAYKPEADIWFGGGAQLAAAAFELLEAEGEGLFYETVVHDTYPLADTYMPEYDQGKWTEPKVIREYPEEFIARGRQTSDGIWLPVQTPAYTIQVRSVKK